MSLTKNKLKYINPSNNNYANLGEEILDLHSKIENTNDYINEKTENINNIINNINNDIEIIKQNSNLVNTEIINEVATARGVYANLNERINEIENNLTSTNINNLNTYREYRYDNEGNITEEIVRGDINYNIKYIYNKNKNIVKEEIYDIYNNLIGYKDYIYDADNNIKTITSNNADILNVVSNDIRLKEINKKLDYIENLDITKITNIINYDKAKLILDKISEYETRIENLENFLPNNISNNIEIPYILQKLNEIENKLDQNYIIYEFTVYSNISIYSLPKDIIVSSVYIEGLLLNKNEDYILENNKIKFLIPLIDGFKVTIKY